MNSPGLILAQAAQLTQENARARARIGCFAKRASVFWLTQGGFGYCFLESLTVCRKVHVVLILYTLKPSTVDGDAQGSDELVNQLFCSATAVVLWPKPNSSLEDHFPPINFITGALKQLVHGDRADGYRDERVPARRRQG